MLIRFETLQSQHLIGQLVENPVFSTGETSHLWRGFRSQLREILPEKETALYSVQGAGLDPISLELRKLISAQL